MIINGTEPHFMKVAARNAFLIFARSAGSGRMGRILCRTLALTRPAPLASDMQPERRRGVECRAIVGPAALPAVRSLYLVSSHSGNSNPARLRRAARAGKAIRPP